MKTKYILISVAFATAFFGIASLTFVNPSAEVKMNQAKYQQYVVQPKMNRLNKYDRPKAAAQWWGNQLVSSTGESPAQLNIQLAEQIKKQEQLAKSRQALKADGTASDAEDIPNLAFENIGPGIFGGRIRAFVVKPDESGVLLAGGVSGGIWKSIDDGQSWQAKTDFLSNIAIGSMVVDPDNPNRVFAGTGEGFFNFDLAQGAGIFVSEDFGETWEQLASTRGDEFLFVNRLTMVPGTNIIVAATYFGIYRSTDLGNSWQEVSGYFASGRGFVDIKTDPSNANHLLAVHYGGPNDEFRLTVTSPASIAGDYPGVPASFGPAVPASGISGEVVVVDDGVGSGIDGCETITQNLTGSIALMQRGDCDFTEKVKNAQNAGAAAAVIFQNSAALPFAMGGSDDTITIPSAMISRAQGQAIENANGTVNASLGLVVKDEIERFVMRSNDAGENWTILDDSNGLPVTDVGRMELGFGSDGVTYVSVANSEDQTRGLWRSAGGDSNFSKTASNAEYIERQGWYDLAITVKPGDSSTVFMGAVDAFKTTNSGVSINQTSFWAPQFGQVPQYVHADHHGYVFDPQNANHMYAVTDGGVYKTVDGGDSFFSLNNGLGISQSYGIAVHPNGQLVTSGTQDNGSQIYFGDSNSWLEWRGGDGGYSAWDQQDGDFVYGSNPNGGMFGSNNGGLSNESIELPDTDGSSFIQPFVLNPNNGNQMLVGTDNVFYSGDIRQLGNANWTDVSSTANLGRVSTLTFSPVVNNQAFAGGENGRIYRLDNLGASSTATDISITSSNGASDSVDFITDIVVDDSDSSGQTLYATMAFYDAHRVYKTTNGGDTWQSIAGNLPDIPLFRLAIDPLDSNRLYVGSELGLWTTDSTGSGDNYQWYRYDYGTAFTRVVDLIWSDENTLYVGTHGRGTYRVNRDVLDVKINRFVATNSSCDRDGIPDENESGLLLVDVSNQGGTAVNNVLLSLRDGADIDILDDTETLNVLNAGETATVAFNVKQLSTTCPGLESLSVEASYASGSFEYPLELATSGDIDQINTNFFDGGESSVDTLFTLRSDLGNTPWTTTATQANSGERSWFVADVPRYADQSLLSPWLLMTGDNTLSFAMRYNMEGDSLQYWDGVLLELRTEQEPLWIDIGQQASVQYDGLLFVNNTAPARPAWSGLQNQWRNVEVNLADRYKGQKIQFRFRMIADENTAVDGFWLDDVNMSNVIFDGPISCDTCQSDESSEVPLAGLWYDPSRSGHGFVIHPVVNSIYFTTFYTYDEAGRPEWYTFTSELNDGVLNIDMQPDALKRFLYDFNAGPSVGNPSFADPSLTTAQMQMDFNTDTASANALCQDGATGRNANASAIMSYQINNQSGSWCIQPLVSEVNKSNPDFGGSWYAGPTDSGWGLSLTTTKEQLVALLYYYDATGKPRWAIGQTAYKEGEQMTVSMREAQGFGREANPIEPTFTQAGSMNIRLSHTSQSVEVDGQLTVDVEYQGSEGGRWVRNGLPITVITEPR